MMDINLGLLQRSIDSLIKNTFGGTIKNENMSNKELAEEIHKPINRKFNKRKVYSSYMDNIQDADLGDMQLSSKFK